MQKRPVIALSMAGGMVWALIVVGFGQAGNAAPFEPVVFEALAPAGAVPAAMIGYLAKRRFFDDRIIDGDQFSANSPAEIDQRVFTITIEQIVLALCLWPFAAVVLGWQLLVTLGWSFAISRVLFWAGYHLSPPLRGLGFAATFYTSVVAGLWALIVLVLG